MGDLNNQYRYKIQIVKPQAGRNLVWTPIPFHRLDRYEPVTSAISLNSVHTRRGPQCIRVVPNSDTASGVRYSFVPVTSGLAYTFSVDVLGVKGQAMRIYIASSGGAAKATTEFVATGNWQRKSVTFIADTTSASYRLYVVRDSVASTEPFWVDGFQFEQTVRASTFIQGWMSGLGYMGNFPEYGWEGNSGDSVSWRSQWTRHGGELVDIRDYAKIMKVEGLGMSPFEQITTPIVTGGELYQKHIRKARPFSIDVMYTGENIQELQKKRQTILDLLRPDYSPYDQPLVLRIQTLNDKNEEVSDPVDVVCVFETSHTNPPNDVTSQRDTLYFRALDGHLLGAFKNGNTLDYKVEFTANGIIRRDPNGSWVDNDELSPVAGITGNVVSIVELDNKNIFVLGQYGSDNFAVYDITTRTWTGIPTGLVVGVCITKAANGNVFIGCWATDPSDPLLSVYNGTAVNDLILNSTLTVDKITCMEINSDGVLWCVGDSTNSDVGFLGRYYPDGTWDQSLNTWRGISCMKWNKAHTRLYLGGNFTGKGETSNADYICYYNPSDGKFYPLGGTALNGRVRSIDIMPDGTLVIGGEFTGAGGDPNANRLAKWNGTNWQSIGGAGANSAVNNVVCTEDGSIYVMGSFTQIGALMLSNKIAVYKNGAWQPLEVIFPAGADIYTVLRASDSSLYIGGAFTGTITAINPKEMEYKISASSGSANTYPQIEIVGPGRLESITNYSTGRTIRFNDLTLLEGEKIWIDFNPVKLKMWSSWEGRGSVWKYLNAGSDIGDWYIQPGKNSIGVFIPKGFDVNETKAYIQWFPKYWGLEGAVYE